MVLELLDLRLLLGDSLVLLQDLRAPVPRVAITGVVEVCEMVDLETKTTLCL